MAVQGLRRLPVHACACRDRQNGGRGVGHRRAVLQFILNGNVSVGLIFGAVGGKGIPRPVHHLKADGIAALQLGVLRNSVDKRAVGKAGIKVAAGVFQCALGPELGLFAPDGNGKALLRQNFSAVCRDRPAAVSVLHPQAQRHGLLLGVGEVLNDGAQLDLLPLHVRREAVFIATAQKAVLPILLIPPIAGVFCISISIGVFGGIFIVAGIQLHLRDRRIEGGRVGDQLAHALGTLKGAHVAELVSCILPHEALKAGIVHIRIVRVRAGIGVTEAQHILPLYLRGVRRVRDIQRGAVGRLPHGGRAGRILVAQMKQSVSQLMAQDKRGGVVFRGCQDIVDAAFYLIVGAAEILSAVRQHNKLVDVLINVIILSVFIGLRHGRVGNVRVMDLFKEGRAYDALENVVSPASVVDGDAVFIRLKKRAAAAKAVYRRRADRIDIEAVRHVAVRLRFQRFPPQPLNIFDEIRLLAFGVALGTEQDHHVLRVAAGLLDHIHRNGGVGVLTVGRVALAHLHLKIRLGVHIPVPVAGVPLGGRKRGAVRGLARRGAHIGVSRRAAAGGHGIIRRVQIERRTDAVVALAGSVAPDAPLRGHIAHIVVAVRHRRPQPVVPADAVPVLRNVVAAEVFIDGVELLDIQQEHLVGDVLVMCALIAVRHRADVGVVGEVGPRCVDVARGVLRMGTFLLVHSRSKKVLRLSHHNDRRRIFGRFPRNAFSRR